MVSTLLVAFAATSIFTVYTLAAGLRKNILKARKTGIKYIVLRSVMLPDWSYNTGQEYFQRLGAETFITVSPLQMLLFTEHAEVIHRLTQRRELFPKDISLYGVLSLFGQNVLTTEGPLWRMHRKVTSASFNEKNAAFTFSEAIKQTEGLMAKLFEGSGEQSGTTGTITTLEHETIRWALNIIGYVGFGLKLLWPGQTLSRDVDPALAKYSSLEPPPGHTMTFADSVEETLARIVAIMLLPDPILKFLPAEFARKAYKAKVNYLQYMDEFMHDKAKEAREGNSTRQGMDIMGQLVQSTYGPKASEDGSKGLSDAEIVGNAFIMIVAGHETTANTLHFALLELANNPAAQRRLQQDIDTLFGDQDPHEWDYEKNINAMLGSHIGACLNETLRLMPPVNVIPKVVTHDSEQTITIDGQTHVLPPGLTCNILSVSVQRNPRWWPTKPSERTGAPTDLDDFMPERWYRSATLGKHDEEDSAEDYGGFKGSDTSASLYRPVRGSYVPFSDGPRSCLGRRIAVVEVACVLAVIFQKYSIELAVEEWASDEEVERMEPAARRAVYAKAQEKSRQIIKGATSLLTLKLHGGNHVPVRFEKLLKNDLELLIDDYVTENATRLQSNPKLRDFFKSRARAEGSPIKKERYTSLEPRPLSKRRQSTKLADEVVVEPSNSPSSAASTSADAEEDTEKEDTPVEEEADESSQNVSAQVATATNALIRTPGRALAAASRHLSLPATPADVAQAVEHGTVALRERVGTLYQESGITEAAHGTREWLSTVHSVLSTIALFEAYKLRQELLPDRYAFTFPAISFLGNKEYPVKLPDMFALVTSSFWIPALTWLLTSTILPAVFGYFFNLSLAAQQRPSGRRKSGGSGRTLYNVDPLTFSIVKALATYVVYAQGVTLGGWIDPVAVARINGALYSGWKGVLVGTGVAGVMGVYDAVLRK
ncbi:cytochrome P450 [Podospora australis]|uniref:Cytochrome P450 n=1 Tax=Podospora australis TaxID=1536484 RepID=A0AAN6X1B2_9PEZI|nr:cytochrome P450 [Podospora australis]